MSNDDTIPTILQQRGSTHGDFTDNGEIAMELRTVMHNSPNWANLAPFQQLALDEDALKTARILSRGSDPNFLEHWKDKAGYASVVINQLEKNNV